MVVGIIMAASGNHSVYPAHAHLNLLGWVSLFLIGIFYRFHPAVDASRVALIHVAIWICGTIVLSCGVAAIFLGRRARPFVLGGAGLLAILLGIVIWLGWRGPAEASQKAVMRILEGWK